MTTQISPPKPRAFMQTRAVGGNLASLTMPSGTTAVVPIEAKMSSDEIGSVRVVDKRIVDIAYWEPKIDGLKIFAKVPGRTTICLHRKLGGNPILFDVIVTSRLATHRGVPLRIRLNDMLLLRNEGSRLDAIDANAMEFATDFEPQSVLKQLASVKYQHMYFSCHTFPTGSIKLGRGITNAKDFGLLENRVSTLWLCTCAVLAHEWGPQLVRDIVIAAGCNVVAATTAVPVTANVGRNVIELRPENGYTAYRPDGKGGVTAYSEDAFYGFAPELDFEVIKLGDSTMP